MQDTNGNQVLVRYNAGNTSPSTNSSARINQIEDVRAGAPGASSYLFYYNTDPIPHLTSITGLAGTGESYNLTYNSYALNSPFGGASFGTTTTLATLTNENTFLATGFTYDSAGTGELARVTAPYGAYLRWTYANDTLTGGTVRQVQYRYVAMSAGASENTHQFIRYDSGVPTHGVIGMYDVGGQASRVWYMQSNIAAVSVGLVVAYQESSWSTGADTLLKQDDYTWSQNTSGNQYIAQVVTTLDPGQTYAKHKTSNQTVDQYGNLTSLQITDFNGAVRTYNSTYLTDANYTSRYMFNRLTGSSVTGGGQTSTLVSNSYDQFGQLDVSGM